ncbi:unnamed protein product, partial [Orchesella dallaii]
MNKNCEEKFGTEVELKSHVEQSHILESGKQHLCKLCGKEFTRQGSLTLHKSVHTKEKPHKCHVCSQAFPQKSSLKGHLAVVHGERKEQEYFKCDQPNCEAKFKCRSYMVTHLRKLH